MMYEYKNDCLAASIEYNKEYYNDRDMKPTEENLFFKLTIIPIGQTNSPNLKKLMFNQNFNFINFNI